MSSRSIQFLGASDLTERITLLRPVITQDSIGDALTSWVEEDTVWAQVTPVRFDESLLNAARRPLERWHIIIRARDDVEASWRLRLESVDYQLLSVMRHYPKQGYIKLKVENIR